MNDLLVIAWAWAAFASMACWEAYEEGKYPWAQRQVGWKFHIAKHASLTAYHFWLNMMIFFFMTLPLFVIGWNSHVAGVLLVAWFTGFVLEDFMWFVVNPFFSVHKWDEKDVRWYPWIGVGKLKVPLLYLIGFTGALVAWLYLW